MTRLSLSLPASKITDLQLGNPGWIAVFVDAFPPRQNPDTGMEERQFPPESGTDKGAPTVFNMGVLDEDSEMWVPVEGRGENSYFRVGRGSGVSTDMFSIETALFDGSNRLTELGADGVQITEVHDLGAVKPVAGYETLVSGTFTLTGSGYADLGVTLPALKDDELFLVEITGSTRAFDISKIVSGRVLKRMRAGVAVGGTVNDELDVRVEGPGERPFYFCELGVSKNLGGAGGDYWNTAFGGSVGVLIKRVGN